MNTDLLRLQHCVWQLGYHTEFDKKLIKLRANKKVVETELRVATFNNFNLYYTIH